MSGQVSRMDRSHQRVPNDESLDMVQRHMRQVANQQRRSTPPRCHPVSIYILVQAFGCIFTGMTMVITANWPGTSSRSSNILKIFGPILLAIGAILLLIGILLARFLRKKEAKTWDKKISQHILSASRQVLDQSIPTITKPRLGPGSEEEKAELLGSPTDLESKLKQKAGMYAVSDTETLNSSSSAFPQSPHNGEDVPDPVRIKKTKKKTGTSTSSFENLHSLKEDDESSSGAQFQFSTSREENSDEVVKSTKRTVKTTTVVTRRTTEGEELKKSVKKPKPPPMTQKPPTVPDSPRLRVKVKASHATSINIRHSGSSFDESSQLQDPSLHKMPNVRPKPKSKPKVQQEFHGTDI